MVIKFTEDNLSHKSEYLLIPYDTKITNLKEFSEASHSPKVAYKNSKLLQNTFFTALRTASTTKDYVALDELKQVYFANRTQIDNNGYINSLIKIKMIKMIIEYF